MSVDYADRLAQSLSLWRNGLDSVTVVTSPKDKETVYLCTQRGGVSMVLTDAFYLNGAKFNKAAGLNRGLAYMARNDFGEDDWLLQFDPDVIPPAHWRMLVNRIKPEPANIYGAKRTDETGQEINDKVPVGFFMLFHVGSMQAMSFDESFTHAASYDSEFVERWPHENWKVLDLTLQHIGPTGTNWFGKGNESMMDELRRDRAEHGGWRNNPNERIAAGWFPDDIAKSGKKMDAFGHSAG